LSERKILTFEHDGKISRILKKRLELKGAAFTFLGAGSVEEALEVLDKETIDMVVGVHRPDEGSDGIELLKKIRERGLTTHTALLADPDLEDRRAEALAHGCSIYLTPPFDEEQFSEMIYNSLTRQQGFRGRVVGMRLEDVIQMFCYRKDGTLLQVMNGPDQGVIYVNEGGIVHAQTGELEGVEAFYEIVGWEGGEFLSQVTPDLPQQTVYMDWQSLLMEGMRQKDEIRHALGPYPQEMVSKRGTSQQITREKSKRVMVVDDSRFIRKIVQEILESDHFLTVAGYATNGQDALDKIDELKPDLILLDWDMPIMKGSTTLMHIMIRSPCPVVVLSGFVGGVGANPFDLLCLGAVDFLRKPQNNWRRDGRADDLVHRVREACGIHFERIRRVRIPSLLPDEERGRIKGSPSSFMAVLASSIGGCSDLIRIIPSLTPDFSASIVALHDMQEQAIGAFVDYLNRRSRVPVKQVESGDRLLEGVCYIHPATIPLEAHRENGHVILKVIADMPETNVMDHFLVSASKVMGPSILGMLLSGGPQERGTDGLRAVKQAEGTTVVQDPESSIDPRMAQKAVETGVVDHRWPADLVAGSLEKIIS
jgi:two-component system chemotaxis response regulator CheB